MNHFFSVYLQGVKNSFKSAMAYRTDFFLRSFLSLAGNMILPVITFILYRSGVSYPGWSFYEALLIQAVFTASMGIASMIFFSLVWYIMEYVQEGSLDLLLLRPGPLLLNSVANTFDLEGLGLFGGGVFLMIVALSQLSSPSFLDWITFLFLFLMGIIVIGGFVLFMAATSFKWIGNSRIPEIFAEIAGYGKYPIAIFPISIQIVASFVLPVAMIGFFPASALLHRFSLSMLISAIPCLLFFICGYFLFRKMVQKYQSAGG